MAEQELFPIPSLSSASGISPSIWPGVSPSSTKALRKTLKDNHERWHVFFNRETGFHNHATHYAIALWALGADESIIEAGYELDCVYQLPAFESPEPITTQNFKDHLGDDKYYNAYLKFFTEVVRSKGSSAAVEEYVFHPKMSFDTGKGADNQPEMLSRFLDAVVHPLIHIGYGFEFGLPGMVVEGLASTAVHKTSSTVVITPAIFQSNGGPMEVLTSHLPSALNINKKFHVSPSTNVHAFSILARILRDDRLDATGRRDEMEMYKKVMKAHGDLLKEYASEWTINISNHNEVERKIEELVWVCTMIYGIGGWKQGADFNADFFFMHFVTSSLFLSSLASGLKPASQELLLRGYFVVILAWWVARGRPGFDIPGFFAADTAHPVPVGPLPTPNEKSLPSSPSPKATTPNPWFYIIRTAITHNDDHLPKLQRALAHYGALYGARTMGLPDFSATELPFADKLDGTLFLRVAGLTAKRIGHDGDYTDISMARFWDRRGFYKDERLSNL